MTWECIIYFLTESNLWKKYFHAENGNKKMIIFLPNEEE